MIQKPKNSMILNIQSLSSRNAIPGDNTTTNRIHVEPAINVDGTEELKEPDSTDTATRSASLWYLTTILSGLVSSIILSGALTLILMHNVLEQPAYWYEFMFATAIDGQGFAATFIVFAFIHWVQVDVVKKWKSIFMVYCFGIISYLIYASLYYLLWVYVLGYTAPTPFNHF